MEVAPRYKLLTLLTWCTLLTWFTLFIRSSLFTWAEGLRGTRGRRRTRGLWPESDEYPLPDPTRTFFCYLNYFSKFLSFGFFPAVPVIFSTMKAEKNISNISKSTSWFHGSKLMIDLTHSHIWGPCTCILWLVRFFVTLWSATDSISWNLVVRISPIWKPKALHGKNYLPPLPSSTDQGDIMFLLNKNMNLPKKEESLLGGKRANETDYYSRYPV